MNIFNKCYIPSFKRFSSIQIPYFFHTAILYPYQKKESSGFYINFEKRQIFTGKDRDVWFVNENFTREILNFKYPRENVLIAEIPEEEEVFQLINKAVPYLTSLQCGINLIINDKSKIQNSENHLSFFSLHNFILFNENLNKDTLKADAFLYPFFPGFSDEVSIWEEHLSYLKQFNVQYIFPFALFFDSQSIKNFFDIAKDKPSILKKVEEVFHLKSRKEYIKNLWHKFIPFARSKNFKILPPLPPQAGELYENRILAQRAFFLWHWLVIMERDIEAWQFHRLGFKLWRLQYPIKEIFKEGNLQLFELNLIEDYLKGDTYLYPDEEIWL